MTLKRRAAFLKCLVFSLAFWSAGLLSAGDDVLYRSANKIDFVKLDKANKREKEGGLKHPTSLGEEQIRRVLASLAFSKKNLVMKDLEDRRLFSERNVEFLAPYLIEAFKKATPEQVVAVSYFSREAQYGVMNDRLSVFRAFVKEDGLHFRFTKLYAKLLGDRTTQGSLRATREAQSVRVQLEPAPGQALISLKPTEVIFDLDYFLKGSVAAPEKKPLLLHTHEHSEKGEPQKTVKERLKELENLRDEELITKKEYQKKRQDLLKEL